MIKRNYELWKPIEGFLGYEISNMGRVRSLTRTIKYKNGPIRLYAGKLLKNGLNKHGYYQLNLCLNSKQEKKAIHVLVIKHFGDPKPTPKHECNHKDGIKANNWDTNLEWMTRKENIKHAYDLGLAIGNSGEKNGYSKHSRKDIIKIRKMYTTGRYTQTELAKMFDVGQNNISDIVLVKIWRNI